MRTEDVLTAIQDISKLGRGDLVQLEQRVRSYLRANGWESHIRADRSMSSEDMVKFLLIQQYRQQIVINNLQAQVGSAR
ncbi:MAG: hypothetical protein ACKOC5_09600 [Chloroflexota bacterium]